MNKIFFVILTILFVGCATKQVSPEHASARRQLAEKYHLRFASQEDFMKAITQGNLAAVKLFMSTRDGYPFSEFQEEGLPEIVPSVSTNMDRPYNRVVRDDYLIVTALRQPAVLSYLLSHPATSNQAKQRAWEEFASGVEKQQSKCSDRAFDLVLEKAGRPAGEAVRGLFAGYCDSQVVTLLKKYPDLVKEEPVLRFVEQEIKNADENEAGLTENLKVFYSEVLPVMKNAAQTFCSTNDVMSCQLVDLLKEQESTVTKLSEKNRAFDQKNNADLATSKANEVETKRQEETGETALHRACQANADAKGFQQQLSYQQKIERTSGVRNLQENYRLGQLIESSKGFMQAMAEEYKSKSGRTFTLAECKKLKK